MNAESEALLGDLVQRGLAHNERTHMEDIDTLTETEARLRQADLEAHQKLAAAKVDLENVKETDVESYAQALVNGDDLPKARAQKLPTCSPESGLRGLPGSAAGRVQPLSRYSPRPG